MSNSRSTQHLNPECMMLFRLAGMAEAGRTTCTLGHIAGNSTVIVLMLTKSTHMYVLTIIISHVAWDIY